MKTHEQNAAKLQVSSLSQNKPTRFTLIPDEPTRRAIAQELDISALKKLRFEGEITPEGKRGFSLSGMLGATVVQACVVTLAPVTLRIDERVSLSFVPPAQLEKFAEASEVEMPDDDRTEALGEVIDLELVMTEALMLNTPAYPRADGAALDVTTFAAEGITPLQNEELKPLAGLAALRDKLAEQSGAATQNAPQEAGDESGKDES